MLIITVLLFLVSLLAWLGLRGVRGEEGEWSDIRVEVIHAQSGPAREKSEIGWSSQRAMVIWVNTRDHGAMLHSTDYRVFLPHECR